MSKIDESNESNKEEAKVDNGDLGYVFFTKRRDLYGNDDLNENLPIFTLRDPISYHNKCLKNALKCINNDPFAKLLIKAMKSRGCEFNPERHLSCEPCIGIPSGGYDINLRQVAICENNSPSYERACAVLRHELIHAYDYCRAKVDLINNIHHLACTEIRAANFLNCSYLSGMMCGTFPFTKLKNMHEYCVREKAVASVLCVRNVKKEEAYRIVDEVFDTCYRDLEPMGRKIKKRSFDTDAKRAYYEAKYYGYYEDGVD